MRNSLFFLERFFKFSIFLMSFFFIYVGFFSSKGLLDLWRVKKVIKELEKKTAKKSDELANLEYKIHLFNTGPLEQEYMVRKMLGVLKTDEVVIDFN